MAAGAAFVASATMRVMPREGDRRMGEIDQSVPPESETCPKCGAIVGDRRLHAAWHKKPEDAAAELRRSTPVFLL